jgi:hypothetical protein
MQFLRNKVIDYGRLAESELKRTAPKASGALASSIYSRVISLGDGSLQLEVYGEGYALNIENGRPAGSKQAPVSSIVEWMQNKGIAPYEGQTIQQAAFFIAKKIGRDGIEPKKFVEDFLEKNIASFADQALIAFGDDIQLVIERETQNLK